MLNKFSPYAIYCKAHKLNFKAHKRIIKYNCREEYKITCEELRDLYLNRKWPSSRIAELHGCSVWVIRDRFKKCGIQFRKRAESID